MSNIDKEEGFIIKLDLLNLLKDLTGIETGKEMELIFNSLGDQAPVIGRVLTTIKIRRLQQRLNKIQPQLATVSEKIRTIDDEGFITMIKDFLFPDLLQQLLEEDEDNKIGFFLNGFNHVIDEKVYDQSKLLIYYDVLKSLRYVEIEYLITYSSQYTQYRYDRIMLNKKYKPHFTESPEFSKIKQAIENKLENFNLIDTGRLIQYNKIRNKLKDDERLSKRWGRDPDERREEQKPIITYFGQEFVSFFDLAKNINKILMKISIPKGVLFNTQK